MRFDELKFRAGTTPGSPQLEVLPGKLTVFIGPNNGGKSLAIRELHQYLTVTHQSETNIFDNIRLDLTAEELNEKRIALRLEKRAGDDPRPEYVPYGRRAQRALIHEESYLSAIASAIKTHDWSLINQIFLAPYTLNLDGQSRLTLVNSAGATRLQEQPTSTLGALFVDDTKRKALSEVVNAAFNLHLVIDPTAMSAFEYALSVDPPLGPEIERALTNEAVAFYGRAMPVSQASDGTKAFIGIMAEIIAGEPEVLFIDEPEAFLHPSLQYALGKEISRNLTSDKQVFIATHSPEFLMACLASGEAVDVVRLTHHNGLASARILASDRLSKMMNDPLFRSVGVLSALFYKSAVLVEGGSDSAFYDEINNRLERYGHDFVRHTLFLNAHNKQSAAELARPLREVGVPTAILLDLDWIKEDGQVARRYMEAAGLPPGLYDGKLSDRRQVRRFLEIADVNYTRNGGLNLIKGDELQAAKEFLDTMDRYGLFTVREGELESWLKTTGVSPNKSMWLSSIFEAMGDDPSNPSYMRPADGDVWEFIRRIGKWIADERRSGMP